MLFHSEYENLGRHIFLLNIYFFRYRNTFVIDSSTMHWIKIKSKIKIFQVHHRVLSLHFAYLLAFCVLWSIRRQELLSMHSDHRLWAYPMCPSIAIQWNWLSRLKSMPIDYQWIYRMYPSTMVSPRHPIMPADKTYEVFFSKKKKYPSHIKRCYEKNTFLSE